MCSCATSTGASSFATTSNLTERTGFEVLRVAAQDAPADHTLQGSVLHNSWYGPMFSGIFFARPKLSIQLHCCIPCHAAQSQMLEVGLTFVLEALLALCCISMHATQNPSHRTPSKSALNQPMSLCHVTLRCCCYSRVHSMLTSQKMSVPSVQSSPCSVRHAIHACLVS